MTVYIIFIVIVVAIALIFFYQKVFWPIQRLRQLSEDLSKGQSRGGFVPDGALGLSDITKNLEEIAAQLNAAAKGRFDLEAILASMPHGVMVVDLHRCIRLANSSLIDMFEVTSQVEGRTVIEALRHVEIQQVVETTLLEKEKQAREIVIREDVDHPDQRSVLALNAAPLHDSEGSLEGVVVVFHDITRIRQLEQMRQEFVANVSHELKTPLSIFRGYLETLMDSTDITLEEYRRILGVLNRHSDRLNSLVNDLLSLARLEAGAVEFKKSKVGTQTFLSCISEDWKKAFDGRNCRIEISNPSGVCYLWADPHRLEQVMNNLLDNALKYSEEGSSVEIGLLTDEDMAEVRCYVKDYGSGIPKDKLPHIFERFYRVDKARSRAMGGTGLGLSIVKHIVQLHGGRVWAESAIGSGTTIWFSFPNPPDDLALPTPPDHEHPPKPHQAPAP